MIASMQKPMAFAITYACLVIVVSCAALFSFAGSVPRESQVARISSIFPCPKDGILPALPNPNFPPPPLVPLEPEPDPLDVGDLPMPELPPAVPASGRSGARYAAGRHIAEHMGLVPGMA